ncbi:MAG: hypothetical protein QOH54_1739, partial [Mycobacterium sp.]|nr:hypothetical protein [Mycobacterium sp.]
MQAEAVLRGLRRRRRDTASSCRAPRHVERERLRTEPPVRTTDRWRIAVGGSGARCYGSDSCTSVAVSHSSDRSAASFPVDCSSGCRRCGPTPMRGAGPATRSRRRRSRRSPTGRRRDTAERSELGRCRSTPRRIRANVWYRCRAGPTPDMRYCSRSSGCASRVLNRSRGTVSCSEATTGYRQQAAGFEPRLVEPPIGIEPMTFRLQGERSTTELRRRAETGPIVSAQSSWSMT